jgi:hypothetical protein
MMHHSDINDAHILQKFDNCSPSGVRGQDPMKGHTAGTIPSTVNGDGMATGVAMVKTSLTPR